ncbi:hypothetical protein PIB30_113363, partial [Stylosanthes scabra]|nr:hypothetical protein [Stylosanthes scabra]
MGRGKEEAPPHQAQEPQAEQSEPSIRDLMGIMQRMELNQQHLSQQMINIQQEQQRIWRSVRRIEAHTFNEDYNMP